MRGEEVFGVVKMVFRGSWKDEKGLIVFSGCLSYWEDSRTHTYFNPTSQTPDESEKAL